MQSFPLRNSPPFFPPRSPGPVRTSGTSLRFGHPPTPRPEMNASRYKKESLVRKLYNREVYGQFIRGTSLNHEPTKQLFPTVPDRLIFHFWDTLPKIGNHILMGATRCGQLLLTYTYTVDPSSVFSPSVHYRYRLHFWAFRPGCPATKVAEVQLFDGSDIVEVLTVGIVQWPNVNDRLLVFGNCHGPESIDSWGSEYEYRSNIYITVTTMPSLSGCADCRAVAASFDEEEMAANWDSGVGLTCLKHGLTIHTWFSVPYPYEFDPQVCASTDNQVVINTGSFVHVLTFGIQKLPPPTTSSPAPKKFKPNIVNLPIKNRLSYSFLRKNAYYVFLSDTWACNMTQMLIDLIHQGLQVEVRELPYYLKIALQKHLQMAKFKLSSDAVIRILMDISSTKTSRPNNITTVNNKPKSGKRTADDAYKVYDFKESDDGCEPKFKLYRRRCLADKMYEFRSDEDTDMENIRPRCQQQPKFLLRRDLQEHNKKSTGSPPQQQHQQQQQHQLHHPTGKEEIGQQPKTDSFHRRQRIFFRCNVDPTERIPLNLKASDLCSDSETEEEQQHTGVQQVPCPESRVVGATGDMRQEISLMVQAIIADWESSEQEWGSNGSGGGNCPSTGDSRPDAKLSLAERRQRNVASFLAGLIEGSTVTRRRQTQTSAVRGALKPSNRNPAAPALLRHNTRHRLLKADTFELTDSMRKEMEKGFGHQPVTGCSVQFTRRFIEIDQEITSTITDIEDDEIAPGFQCALPLSVHGSAYSQMEMISNQKAEKLNVLCAVVTQSTLDIEHFCYKAAESICRMEGFKFWFCSDYDTEVVSVCPLTEDMLFVVFIRLNAEDISLSNNESTAPNAPTKPDMRNFYECSCLGIWSAAKATCYLEGYTGLTKVALATPKPWIPAAKEARLLRSTARSHFAAAHQRPVRSFVHHVKDGQLVSVAQILDHDNLVGFRKY